MQVRIPLYIPPRPSPIPPTTTPPGNSPCNIAVAHLAPRRQLPRQRWRTHRSAIPGQTPKAEDTPCTSLSHFHHQNRLNSSYPIGPPPTHSHLSRTCKHTRSVRPSPECPPPPLTSPPLPPQSSPSKQSPSAIPTSPKPTTPPPTTPTPMTPYSPSSLNRQHRVTQAP
jgi:hypothetical protein